MPVIEDRKGEIGLVAGASPDRVNDADGRLPRRFKVDGAPGDMIGPIRVAEARDDVVRHRPRPGEEAQVTRMVRQGRDSGA